MNKQLAVNDVNVQLQLIQTSVGQMTKQLKCYNLFLANKSFSSKSIHMIIFCVDEGTVKCEEVSCQKRHGTTSFDSIHSLRVLLSYGYFRYIDYMPPLNHREDSQPVFMQTVMHYRVGFTTFELL